MPSLRTRLVPRRTPRDARWTDCPAEGCVLAHTCAIMARLATAMPTARTDPPSARASSSPEATMASPREITDELRVAVAELDRAVIALNFDLATRIHGHVQDLLEDLYAALPS